MLNTNKGNIMENKVWTVPLEADPDDPESLILTFPDELLEETGWAVGDTLIWIVEDNGSVTITKK